MTKLTSKQLKIIADYEALCREIMPANMTCISYAIGDANRRYGFMNYLGGAIMFDTFQQGLDEFEREVPSQCELARRKVKQLEDELAAAKSNMELVCNV